MIFKRANVSSAYWIIFVFLIMSLSALTYFFVNHQRNVLLKLGTESLQNEILLAAEFIQEDVASERYEHIEPFFAQWKRDNDKIVSMRVVIGNGFVLRDHELVNGDLNVITLNKIINEPMRIDLEIKYDLSDIENSIQELTIIIVSSYVVFVFFLMFLLWHIVQYYLVKPLRESENKFIDLATKDPLTKVNNRRAFNELADRELSLCKRHARPLCILMLDLDHFKRINDNFGHQVGDHILQLFTTEVQMIIRDTDVFGRLGGEEFAVCLPELTLASALHTAERIRVRIESLPMMECQDNKHPITVSIGVCQMRDGDTVEEMLHRCDKALYEAKDAGRNCICSSDKQC